MTPPSRLRLVLFFTRGVSLQTWEETGLITREVVLYQRLALRGVDVTFITHGGPRDLEIARSLSGIRVRCNRWHLPGRVYRRWMLWLHRHALAEADVLKTNQIPGGEIASEAARRFRKPLVARCGYLWSKNVALEFGEGAPQTQRALAVEDLLFHAASRVVVTTGQIRDLIGGRFPDLLPKIHVIPNYIDTDTFRPYPKSIREPNRITFVGRLAAEKNIGALLDAVRGLDVNLDIVGRGPLEESLRAAAGNPRVRFLGAFPNDRLPEQLNRSAALVLPSLYEGQPKTVMEAMSCTTPVIATAIEGTDSLVTHEVNGLLCQPDAASLRAAIQRLIADPALQARLGQRGRQTIVERCSLERVLQMELDLHREVAAQHAAR